MTDRRTSSTRDLLKRRAERESTDSQVEGYFARQEKLGALRPSTSRVVAVPLSQIWPDRYQPRPVAPYGLKTRFFTGELNCYEVAAAWLEIAEKDPAQRERVALLLNMGDSMDGHGQIKPATGTWRRDGEQARFYLETGERRFWAKALQAVAAGHEDEPVLEVREIASPSRERQVIENRQFEKPTAVGRAREIAALILSRLNLTPDVEHPDEYDYFRTVLEIKRMPAGLWDEVGEVMGLGRSIMVRHLDILRLPNELQDLADLYGISERVLREIVALPVTEWEYALQAAIEQQLTTEDMQSFAESLAAGARRKPAQRRKLTNTQKAASRVRSFLKLVNKRGARDKISQIATEYATGVESDEDLRYAAEVFEELAEHLRLRAEGRGS